MGLRLDMGRAGFAVGGHIVAPGGDQLGGVPLEQLVVLGVDRADQAGLGDELQGLVLLGRMRQAKSFKFVVAAFGRGGHEDFESDGAFVNHVGDGVAVEQTGRAVQAEVDVSVSLGQRLAQAEDLAGGAAGFGYGHLEYGRDAARRGRASLGGEVATLGIGRRATVEVDVDGAGQQQLAGGVDGLAGADAAGVGGQCSNFAIANADIDGGQAGFENGLGIYDQGVKLHESSCWNATTVRTGEPVARTESFVLRRATRWVAPTDSCCGGRPGG